MKNKFYLALLILSLLHKTNTAQKVDIFWGKDNPLAKGGIPEILVKRNNLLLGVNSIGFKKKSILKISIDGLQVKNEYPMIGNSKDGKNIIDNDYKFNDFLVLKNKTYVGVTLKEKKTNTFFVKEITDEGNLTGSLKKISEITSESRRKMGAFDIYASQDSTKILIVKNPPFDKYENEKFGFKIYDENLKELSNLEIVLPYKDKNFSVNDYILAKNGIIYMLAEIQLPRDKKEKGEPEYYNEIVAINPAGKGEVIEYEIKLAKKYITDISYTVVDNDIICSGFYNNIEQKGRSHDEINGIFYIRIDKKTKAISASSLKDLDKKFVADLTSEKKANKGRGIASSFTLKDFIQKDDGGALLVAENTYDYSETVCSTSNGVTTCRTVYHYVRANIVAINIDNKGNIIWYTNIPKLQHTVNDGGRYSSYMFAFVNNRSYFIYNDNSKNVTPENINSKEKLRVMNNPYKSSAVLVSLSESGSFDKKLLFSNKENKMVLMPKSYTMISKNQLVVPALNRGVYCCMIPFKKGKYKFARFSFK